MSSKRAMKQAQKQAYAKHRSNITNNRFGSRKKSFLKNMTVEILKDEYEIEITVNGIQITRVL